MPHHPPDGHEKPLARHPMLQPLSREHMGALIQARNLQRAADADTPVRSHAINDFLRMWNLEIREHFDDEERLLLPLCADDALNNRLLADHGAVRAFAARCELQPRAVAADPADMRRSGLLLHNHVRWEERVFFEKVQREHPGALDALLSEAQRIETQRPGSRARLRLDPRDDARPIPNGPPQ